MANPQPTDAHMRIAHSIAEAIMMRNFTKRQRAILDLILRLSWGCGKKTAIIPLKQDFRLVGVDKTKISNELNWLVNAGVIEWRKETNEFSFLKDFDKWAVSIVPEYDRSRFEELLHINLGCQNGNKVAETATNDGCQNGNSVSKTATKLPKKGQLTPGANTDEKPICGRSKESIKESNKYTHDFEKFYSEYPRPEDKRRTFNNWRKLLKEYTPEQLLAACRRYKAAKAGTDKQYLKSSANFLGRERPFEDYLDATEPLQPEPVRLNYVWKKVGE